MNPDFTIPGYRIQRMLGRGGMAMVYLAIQESFGREVALKILPPTHAKDPGFTDRFLREARIVSRLVHPNIVTVYDVGVHELYHYLSMEYVAGQDLHQAMATLSRAELVRAIIDVAQALDYAGGKGYVHRDVKPENIMIRDEDGRVILMDFGIARGNDTTLDMTRDGRAIGTPYYMSPEQSRGNRVDHRSDIYSLGVVLFQMLTGCVPYEADSAVAVGIKHLTAPIPVLPGPLRCFQPIINTALAKDPQHRYQTAAEMIAALEQINPAQLAALDAEAARFRAAGQDYEAETLLGSEVPPTPPRSRTIVTREQPAIPRQTTHPPPTEIPRRRRSLLFLLLLLTLGAGAWLKQDRLMAVWQQWQPRLLAELADAPEPTTAAPAPQPETRPAPLMPAPRTATSPPAETPAAQKNIRPATGQSPVRQRIQALRAGLDSQPENALELARIFRRLSQKHPDSPLPRKGLRELRRWYQQRIEATLQDGDVAGTRQLLAWLTDSFPRARQTGSYQQLQARLDRLETVQAHLQQAEVYLAAGALTEPPQANALAELQAVLALDPGNAEARTALWHLAETYLQQARQAVQKKDYAAALRQTGRGLRAVPDYTPLLKLREELQAKIEYQAKLDKLLAAAETRRKAGHLIAPKDDSAYHYYRRVLALDKHNTAARKGITRIETQLADRVRLAIANGKLDQAESLLQQAEHGLGQRPRLTRARQQLAAAIEATLPKITRIRLGPEPLDSLEQATPASLPLGRVLYAGFHYENFANDTTLLQAILLDGTGRVQMAQKPVIVSGPAGDHYFDIQLPVEGFSGGSYQLQLQLADKPLTSTAFLVSNPS
jgi:serine/threonine protein kinase/tetratricopeptide (TPR) repeat protein